MARQWKIIQTLISSKMSKSAAEMAEELEINPRTVYRDLEALQVAGFPIYTDKVDGKNLWSLLGYPDEKKEKRARTPHVVEKRARSRKEIGEIVHYETYDIGKFQTDEAVNEFIWAKQ